VKTRKCGSYPLKCLNNHQIFAPKAHPPLAENLKS
jgi:hypothetical protein